MLFKLLFLFTAVPLLELYLLIKLGTLIGTGYTVLLVVGTGVLGGLLAKHQGLSVLQRVRDKLNRGELPGAELLDGLIIFIAGALLVTPGVLTDLLGLLGLLPPTRAVLRRGLVRWFKTRIVHEAVHVTYRSHDWSNGDDRFLN